MSYEYDFASTVSAFTYRSPESMLLQIIYEQGLIMLLIMFFIAFDKKYVHLKNLFNFNPLLWLIFLEQFLLLQINETSYLIMLVIGVLLSNKNIKEI